MRIVNGFFAMRVPSTTCCYLPAADRLLLREPLEYSELLLPALGFGSAIGSNVVVDQVQFSAHAFVVASYRSSIVLYAFHLQMESSSPSLRDSSTISQFA